MNPTIDLDDKIRNLLDQLDHATPTPPAFAELHHYGRSGPSRVVPLTAAAAVVAIGVGGLVAVTARNDGSATQPAAPPAASQPVPSESQPAPAWTSGPLLSTPLDATSAPFVVLDQPDWPLTAAFGQVSSPLSGGFEGSTVLIGDGPMYDAPLFAATVVETAGADTTTQVTVPSASSLLEMGDPIEVAGTTGSITVTETDEDSGLDGPVLFVVLAARRRIRRPRELGPTHRRRSRRDGQPAHARRRITHHDPTRRLSDTQHAIGWRSPIRQLPVGERRRRARTERREPWGGQPAGPPRWRGSNDSCRERHRSCVPPSTHSAG